MRQVYIDLTTDIARLPSGNFIGYLGEHNATELLISIPQNMVDVSDYQILVMQSGPMIFRSKHIDEDKDKSTYRVGNTIHTKLSKSLTAVSTLSIQVECYKEDENGTATLIGKTPLVPNLVLKPSPDGFPAFNYNGSFEDIENVIEMAHQHTNLDVLKKFATNENGMLQYDGHPIEEIKTYDKPSLLPVDATDGTVAIVTNDDDEQTQEIEVGKTYEYLKLRDNLGNVDFSVLEKFCADNDIDDDNISRDYYLYGYHTEEQSINFGYSKETGHAYFIVGVTENGEYRRLLNPDKYPYENYYYFYLYNPGEPYKLSELTGNDSEDIVPSGWSIFVEYQGNYTVNGTTYLNINYDYIDVILPLDNNDLFIPYFSCKLESTYDAKNTELENEFINKLFVAPIVQKKRGLYIKNGDDWENLSETIKSKTVVVNHFEQLPSNVANGSIGYVLEDETYVDSDKSFSITKNVYYKYFYFNPKPGERGRLFDFSLEISYGTKSGNAYTKVDTAFTLETNIKDGYFYLNIFNRTKNDYDEYVYSYSGGEIKISDNLTVNLDKGWNLIALDDNENIVFNHIDDENAPSISFNGTTYYMTISNLTVEEYPSAVSIPTDIFANSQFTDNLYLAGSWLKVEGDWTWLTLKED